MTAMKRVPIHKKAADVKVTSALEPISYEALDNRLRIMRQQSAGIHAFITAAHMDLENRHEGGPINIVLRELEVLESLLDAGGRYAESVSDGVRRDLP